MHTFMTSANLLLQESCAGSQTELDVWLLDMQPVDGGVMLLAAAVNTQLSPQLHYALG
jgi:hypothetical protein